MSNDALDATDMRVLYAQIEKLCNHFREIRGEAMGIISTSPMPDATLHLNDVLQATEEATTTILDAATAIGTLTERMIGQQELKDEFANEVTRIYVACSFQDISGQRIKKVLRHLNALEEQLLRLSQTARHQSGHRTEEDPLLSGPTLSGEGPSQADVNSLFAQAGNSGEAPRAG